MARQTRAQRRARRAEQQRGSSDGAVAQRAATTRTRQLRAPEPARELRVPGGGFRRFVGESWGELKKVEWPGQNQLIQGVVVVLIACLIVGIWLYASDLVFKRLVQNVFLGQ